MGPQVHTGADTTSPANGRASVALREESSLFFLVTLLTRALTLLILLLLLLALALTFAILLVLLALLVLLILLVLVGHDLLRTRRHHEADGKTLRLRQ